MESSYLNFRESSRTLSGKTAIFEVTSKSGSVLGEVRWYGAWRKYCFIAGIQRIILDEHCLDDIAKFIVEQTNKQKESLQDKAKRLFDTV